MGNILINILILRNIFLEDTQQIIRKKHAYFCKEENCNAYFSNRVNFNKHLYDHIRQIGIQCDYPACSTNKIFKTISTYAVHICRHHNSNFDRQVITNNKEVMHFDTSNICNYFLQEETLNQKTYNQVFGDVNSSEKAISQLYLNLTTKYFLTEYAVRNRWHVIYS